KLTLFLLFAGNLYLWIFAFLYTVPITLLGLTFIISGLLVSQLSSVGVTSHIKIYLTDNPRANFVSVFSIVVMVLVGVAGGYFTIQKYWAANVFYRAFASVDQRPLDETTVDVLRAISFDSRSEVYYQALILLNQSRMLQLAQTPGLSEEEVQARGQATIGLAESDFFEASSLNKLNYQNHVIRTDFMW